MCKWAPEENYVAQVFQKFFLATATDMYIV